MTADELARLPRAPDGTRHELVRGELRTMPPSGEEHGGVLAEFTTSLGVYVRTHGLGRVLVGDVGYWLARNPDTVRAPDLAFVSHESLSRSSLASGYGTRVPELVVEVVSPNDLPSEVQGKVELWLAFGIRMVIVVDPRRRTVAVHRPGQSVRILSGDDVLDGEDVVPGWTLSVRSLFS